MKPTKSIWLQFVTVVSIVLIFLTTNQALLAQVLAPPQTSSQSDSFPDPSNFVLPPEAYDLTSISGVIPYSVMVSDDYRSMSYVERFDLVNGNGNEQNSVIAALCVLGIAVIIVVIGGCAIKKLLDKLPPTSPPPPPPTNSPSITNAPGGPYTIVSDLSPAVAVQILPSVAVDQNNTGMQSWYIASNPHVMTNPAAYRDPYTSTSYTHIVTTSIQGTANLDSTNTVWRTVGSRIIWLSKDMNDSRQPLVGGYFIAYYDSKGNVVGKIDGPVTSTSGHSINPETAVSSVRLLPSEIGTNHFFRLGTVTNEIGIFTEP